MYVDNLNLFPTFTNTYMLIFLNFTEYVFLLFYIFKKKMSNIYSINFHT